jgi:hypothetical protein
MAMFHAIKLVVLTLDQVPSAYAMANWQEPAKLEKERDC